MLYEVITISEPFAEVYMTERTALFVDDEITYNSTVSVDGRIPGRLSFPKVYFHTDEGEIVYFKLAADLYSTEFSTEFSDVIAYMGTASDKETPFFKDMTYAEGIVITSYSIHYTKLYEVLTSEGGWIYNSADIELSWL